MAGWSVDIRDGSLIINENGNFDLFFKKNLNDRGKIESVDYVLTIEGDIVKSTAALVAADFTTFSREVTDNGESSKVLIKRDGVTEHTWDPALGFIGPHVTEFQSVPDEGNADSHWRYRMVVVYRAKPGVEGGSENENAEELDEFRTSVATMKVRGQTVRKVWKASGKSKTSAAAMGVVKTFKPGNLKDLEETLEEHPQDGRATGVWVWSAFQETFCEVILKGGGRSYVVQNRAGLGRFPLLHRRKNQITMVTVRGFVRGPDPSKLVRPSPHVSESDTIKRIDDAETVHPNFVIEDPIQGFYRLPFEEVYWSTQGSPKITHSGSHHVIKLNNAPGSGKVKN